MSIPLLDLQLCEDPEQRGVLLSQLRDSLFDVGFLYIANHGVPEQTISSLVKQAPALFDLPDTSKSKLSKINSPHFLGYTGFAEEDTQGKKDLREQLDFATELPVVYQESGGNKQKNGGRDFSQLFWRLRGPNMWPDEKELPGFRKALQDYHDALANLSYKFVHLVEEAFGIPVGTFDAFFDTQSAAFASAAPDPSEINGSEKSTFLYPQHRLKLNKYPRTSAGDEAQGVGPHRDSSGWLTFLYQVGNEKGLEVLDKNGSWLPVNPIPGTFVVNFGNAFEAATEGAVRATVHRVRAATENDRYSIPFFMGLPLDLKLSEIRSVIPKEVRSLRRQEEGDFAEKGAALPSFLDPRWDCLGESVLRKWIRSHQHVALKWYGPDVLEYYTKQ